MIWILIVLLISEIIWSWWQKRRTDWKLGSLEAELSDLRKTEQKHYWGNAGLDTITKQLKKELEDVREVVKELILHDASTKWVIEPAISFTSYDSLPRLFIRKSVEAVPKELMESRSGQTK